MASATSRPSWRRRLGRLVQLLACGSLIVGLVDVGAAAPSRGCLQVEAAASESTAGGSFMGRSCCPWWLGRRSGVTSAARLSARSTRLSGGGSDFMSGRRPRMLVRRPWSASGVLCAAWAAGCRVVRHRGFKCERRYVGMAVPEVFHRLPLTVGAGGTRQLPGSGFVSVVGPHGGVASMRGSREQPSAVTGHGVAKCRQQGPLRGTSTSPLVEQMPPKPFVQQIPS